MHSKIIQDTEERLLVAGTDIPLHDPKDISYLTKSQVWSDYNREEDLETVCEDGRYSFCVKKYKEEALRAEVSVYMPSFPSKRAVLLVEEYGKPCQKQIIEELVKDGYAVFVPDYCGKNENTLTVFPSSLSYGKIGQGGDHLKKICPTAKETCNYLYSLILRRTVVFIEREFSIKKPAVIGIRDGVEYAMQVAGIEKDIRGLGCIGSCGYSNLLSLSVYRGDIPSMTEEEVAWNAAVSGIAYLIGKDIPVFVGIGSNDSRSDPDRLAGLSRLIGDKNLRFCICNGYADSIHSHCFYTLKVWLRLIFLEAELPMTPTASVKPNKEGVVYAEIKADYCSPIRSASVCYAADEFNHETRNWTKIPCETTGKGEYLALIPITAENQKVFLYPEIVYETGITLCGYLTYADFSGYRLSIADSSSDCVIYSFGDPKSVFKEGDTEPVLFGDQIVTSTIPIGLKGVVNPVGKMILFIGDSTVDIDDGKMLQVDCYSDEHDFRLSISLTDEKGNTYTAQKSMSTDTTFGAALFSCTDFKSETFRPLFSWKEIKRLTVSENIIIGKLLFV